MNAYSPVVTFNSWLRRMLAEPTRRFQLSLLIVGVILAVGTGGYIALEGMSLIDALYMTLITITTVGFGEIHPLSPVGRIFTMVLIGLGVGTGAWALSNGVEIVLGQKLWNSVRRRKMEERIKSLKGHYIVCGYGRTGGQIVRDLKARHVDDVVVEERLDKQEEFLEKDILHIIGDATLDEVLLDAGIKSARGLVAALDQDAGNVMVVLTARGYNPDLLIVGRATSETAESKLLRAGADRVVSPYAIGGHRLALALVQPTVHDFFHRIFNVEDVSADIGEIFVDASSPLAGQTILDSDLRKEWNLTILAIRKENDGEFILSPDPRRVIAPGETLIVIGDPIAIYEFAEKGVGPKRERKGFYRRKRSPSDSSPHDPR